MQHLIAFHNSDMKITLLRPNARTTDESGTFLFAANISKKLNLLQFSKKEHK